MQLIKEFTEVETLTEAKEDKKNYYIQGPFMQAEVRNRNGRVYPRNILARQVEAYQDLIKNKRSLGELSHPATPNLNHERVSHIITELSMDGNNVFGKAKILENMPMGKIVKALMDEGVQLGVSSRGVGSLKEDRGAKIVQPDFRLMTVDIVSDPSAPDAWVENLREGTSWVMESGVWVEEFRDDSFSQIDEIVRETYDDRAEREKRFLKLFENFMNKI